MTSNANCGPNPKTATVTVSGNTPISLSHDSTTQAWTYQSFNVTGTTAAQALSFLSTTTGSCGIVIDKVSLIPFQAPVSNAAIQTGVNLIKNGGFETSPCVQTGNGWCSYSGNQIPNWTIGPFNIDLVHWVWAPIQGDWTVDLNGGNFGGVNQLLPILVYSL